MDKVLLDTDIFSESRKLIDKRVAARAKRYLAVFSHYTISAVTVIEIVKGWHKIQREDRIQEFLQQLANVDA